MNRIETVPFGNALAVVAVTVYVVFGLALAWVYNRLAGAGWGTE